MVAPVYDRVADVLAPYPAGFEQLTPVVIIVVQDDLLPFLSGKRFIDPPPFLPLLAFCPPDPGSQEPVFTAPLL